MKKMTRNERDLMECAIKSFGDDLAAFVSKFYSRYAEYFSTHSNPRVRECLVWIPKATKYRELLITDPCHFVRGNIADKCNKDSQPELLQRLLIDEIQRYKKQGDYADHEDSYVLCQ